MPKIGDRWNRMGPMSATNHIGHIDHIGHRQSRYRPHDISHKRLVNLP